MRIGIDVGGTKTAAVVLDAEGTVTHELRRATGQGPDEVLATVTEAIAALTQLSGCEATEFDTIGIGIPGAVDPRSGRVAHAVNLGLEDLALAELVSARVGRPVSIENDVKAASLGAFHALAAGGEPVASMAYLNLGTGLAAGLVLDGRVHRGANGIAGEIGHIPFELDGEPCPCGQQGCLELYASGSALARMWPTTDPYPAQALFDAADAGDATAIAVRTQFVRAVAAAVRLLVLTVDVDLVVIGGGLSELGERLVAAVRLVLDAQSAASPFLAMQDLSARVRLVPAGFPAAAVGAALIGVEPVTGGAHG